MYTLNILLLNVTGLNSAVKWTCVLEYLNRKSISGALICNTASSGIFTPYILGVSCGHGSVDACRPGARFNKEVQPTRSLNLNSELTYSEMGNSEFSVTEQLNCVSLLNSK